MQVCELIGRKRLEYDIGPPSLWSVYGTQWTGLIRREGTGCFGICWVGCGTVC